MDARPEESEQSVQGMHFQLINNMYPLDPVQPSNREENSSPMAPPYVDENPNVELVEKGMRIAENEKRDAVTDTYEEQALESEETTAALDDIAYPEGSADTVAPEISAIHRSNP